VWGGPLLVLEVALPEGGRCPEPSARQHSERVQVAKKMSPPRAAGRTNSRPDAMSREDEPPRSRQHTHCPFFTGIRPTICPVHKTRPYDEADETAKGDASSASLRRKPRVYIERGAKMEKPAQAGAERQNRCARQPEPTPMARSRSEKHYAAKRRWQCGCACARGENPATAENATA